MLESYIVCYGLREIIQCSFVVLIVTETVQPLSSLRHEFMILGFICALVSHAEHNNTLLTDPHMNTNSRLAPL